MKENPRLYPVFVRISASPSVLSRKYVASITILNCASAKKIGSSPVTRGIWVTYFWIVLRDIQSSSSSFSYLWFSRM
jgi:hypothetical protein